MKGLIIYERNSLAKNGFFADKLKSELSKLKLQAEVVCTDEAINYDTDFAIMRVYDPSVNAELDKRNVPTFNNSVVAGIANDKLKTYRLMKKLDVPVAETQPAEDCTLPFPRVLKARHGHGGSEVFWTSDAREYDSILSSMTDSAIAQPPTGKRGRDLRVYVVGGKPIVGFLRKSDTDFRSNFSLGGSAERYELSRKEKKLVALVCSALDFDFAGIDFLLGEDGLILNEIEDVVGCRMVYTYSDTDIIKIYARHIVKSLKRR